MRIPPERGGREGGRIEWWREGGRMEGLSDGGREGKEGREGGREGGRIE